MAQILLYRTTLLTRGFYIQSRFAPHPIADEQRPRDDAERNGEQVDERKADQPQAHQAKSDAGRHGSDVPSSQAVRARL